MADRGPNPDLWTVKTGPHQPLKGAFHTQRFLSQNLALSDVLLRELYSSTIVNQAIAELYYSAHLSCPCHFLVQNNCFVIIV